MDDEYLVTPDRHHIIRWERESDRDVIRGLPSLRLLRKHFTLGNLVRRRQSFAEKTDRFTVKTKFIQTPSTFLTFSVYSL